LEPFSFFSFFLSFFFCRLHNHHKDAILKTYFRPC
jgi:hypothetical protein